MTNREMGRYVDAACAYKQDLQRKLGEVDRSGYVESITTKDPPKPKPVKTGDPSCTCKYVTYTCRIPIKKKDGSTNWLRKIVHRIVFTPKTVGLVEPFHVAIVMQGSDLHFACEGKHYYTVEALTKEFGRYAGLSAMQECILQFICQQSENL